MKASIIYAIAALTSREEMTEELFQQLLEEARADRKRLHQQAEAAKARRHEAAAQAATPEGKAAKAAATGAKLEADDTASAIIKVLAKDRWMAAAEIVAILAGKGVNVSPQKVSAVLRSAEKAGKVVSAPPIDAADPKKGYDTGEGKPFLCNKRKAKPYKLS